MATTASTVTTLTAYPSLQDAIMRVVTLDPMVSLGLTTVAGMGAGWLIGPFFGNFAWRALHRSSLSEFVAKEKGFFERIKKHRVDPRGASANNPVPDYYGEKVGSVEGYRRWLKDQRAFNRKREGRTNELRS
jgi:mitochondrial import inner membrane translocase subunit TIM23